MEIIFYLAAIVALLSTFMVITRYNGVHALLYLIVSLLSVAVIFFTLGAPFVAALEIIIYAGAIMVLFIFAIMMLNLGSQSVEQERKMLTPRMWIGPSILSLILLGELIYILSTSEFSTIERSVVRPEEVGIALFKPYLLGVELAGILLMAGIIGAYHIGRKKKKAIHRFLKDQESEKTES